jgi:hypothetical protein
LKDERNEILRTTVERSFQAKPPRREVEKNGTQTTLICQISAGFFERARISSAVTKNAEEFESGRQEGRRSRSIVETLELLDSKVTIQRTTSDEL